MDTYRQCLSNCARITTSFTSIQARKKVVKTLKLKKVALTSFDNKRYIKTCGIHSIPYSSKHKTDLCLKCPKPTSKFQLVVNYFEKEDE